MRRKPQFRFTLADALECSQVDQDVNQRVHVGNRLSVAEFGTLDAEFNGLTVDAFRGGALLVDILVLLRFTVELIPQACPDASSHGGDTAAIGPPGVIDWTG